MISVGTLDGQVMGVRVGTGLYAGFLVALLGGLAWATGEPFVFPSLGPTAFVLAVDRRSARTRPRRVVLGHLLGGIAGLVAWRLLGGGAPVTAAATGFSAAGARLAASATVSIVLTSWAMVAADAVHPPACATTLIVSLGLLSTPGHVGLIGGSIVLVVGVHETVIRSLEHVSAASFEESTATE